MHFWYMAQLAAPFPKLAHKISFKYNISQSRREIALRTSDVVRVSGALGLEIFLRPPSTKLCISAEEAKAQHL